MDSSALAELTTEAAATAERHGRANRAALAGTQPEMTDRLPPIPHGTEFVYARDGFLTGKTPDGQWLAGCSLPRRTALVQLKDLETRNTTACFLAPPHAAHLHVALERLRPQQSIIAAVPDAGLLRLFLHCHDFSADIDRGRLWFVAGEDWTGQLAELFCRQPGLPTPTAFIRTIITPDAALEPMIAAAQQVIAVESSRRAQRIHAIAHPPARRTERPRPLRLCVIAPSGFRLWDGAADVLREATASCPRTLFDSDRPTSASPLALAEAAAECDAVVSANISRADAAGIARPDLPWITWLTQPIIPPAATAGPNDHLLLADPAWTEMSRQAGWPADRVHPAAWPVRQAGASAPCVTAVPTMSPTPAHGQDGRGTPAASVEPVLALIADTTPVEVAPEHFDLSSHSLLWESIRQRLLENPFDLDEDPARYLQRWMRRCDVSTEGLDQAAFIDRLIVPTYQQSLARLLIRSGLPLKLHGAGWEAALAGDLAGHRAGPVTSRQALDRAVASATALVHTWPLRFVHPVDACGKPVIRSAGRHREGFLHDVRLALKGQLPPPAPAALQAVSADLILRLAAC